MSCEKGTTKINLGEQNNKISDAKTLIEINQTKSNPSQHFSRHGVGRLRTAASVWPGQKVQGLRVRNLLQQVPPAPRSPPWNSWIFTSTLRFEYIILLLGTRPTELLGQQLKVQECTSPLNSMTRTLACAHNRASEGGPWCHQRPGSSQGSVALELTSCRRWTVQGEEGINRPCPQNPGFPSGVPGPAQLACAPRVKTLAGTKHGQSHQDALGSGAA